MLLYGSEREFFLKHQANDKEVQKLWVFWRFHLDILERGTLVDAFIQRETIVQHTTDLKTARRLYSAACVGEVA